MKSIYFSLIFYFYTSNAFENELLGCFRNIPQNRSNYLAHIQRSDDCAIGCLKAYYRYFSYYHGDCACTNFIGEQITNTTCDAYCPPEQCDRSFPITDLYATGNLVPGPPSNLQIVNVTNKSCRVLWEPPKSYVSINGYGVKAEIVETFSNYPRNVLEWSFGNLTVQSELSNLLPATKYSISVYAKATEGNGASAYQTIITRLADPDNLPSEPIIVSNSGDKLNIKLTPTMNNNGPVTVYRIVVVKVDDNPGFKMDTVLPYKEAMKNGLSYYAAAEISPQDINKEFVVGDGKKYGPYLNAPLDPNLNYKILVGLVSKFNGETKITYSESSGYRNGISILNVYSEDLHGDSPGVIIGLSVAIGLLTFMLITGFIGFIILKSKVISNRQRLSENQELTFQGPMIEIENSGYIHEDEHIPAITHYRNLRQKVKMISHKNLKIEPTNLLGVGKFGKVNSGTLHENNGLTTVTCYSIYDKKMNQENKKSMLQELDVLIKTGKHENIINLLGTSETRDVVVVVMEYAQMNLKALLLGSRDNLPGKISNMSERQALEIAIGICKGMSHLHSVDIMHKQLCARSVYICNGFTPKIGNFGLAQYFSHNKIPDYTRWTALEVFNGSPHNPKSDVWSYACLLWEIASLGGTPYGNIPNNNEIPENLTKGVRLPQLRCIGDEIYQIMLDCWQFIPDERPKFTELIESLESCRDNNLISALSFSLYPSFQYEEFYPHMELSVRPVF